MDFTEEMTDEIAARLRSIVANYKKNQKKFPETKVNLEIYDADKNTILTYSLDEVPDASIILEELEFPEKVKLDYFVDGQKKKTMTLFEIEKPEKPIQQGHNLPQNPFPNQSYAPSPE